MHERNRVSLFLVTMIVALAASNVKGADTEPCTKNYKVEGSFFSAKKYSTWQDFADVDTKAAYKAAYVYIAKSGWDISHSDKDLGVISASRKIGQSGSETLNILVEDLNHGSKVTVTRTESAGLVATKSEVQTQFCEIMGSVAKASGNQ